RTVQTGQWREHRLALGLAAALLAIPLIQLIPLPPAIWTRLPARDQMVLALELAGLQPGWAPLTLTPDHTRRSALAHLPPVAFFLAVLSMSLVQRDRMVKIVIAAAVVGIVLGAAQLVSGGDKLYVWHWTDAGSVNGFFANRNHLA